MVWKPQFEQEGFLESDGAGQSGTLRTVWCRGSPVFRQNSDIASDGNGAPWATLVQGQSRLMTGGRAYLGLSFSLPPATEWNCRCE